MEQESAAALALGIGIGGEIADHVPESQRFTVRYEYDAQTDAELSLQIGETVQIVNKGVGDWWFAETQDGATGWIPSNFLNPEPVDTPPSTSDNLRLLPDPDVMHGITTEVVKGATPRSRKPRDPVKHLPLARNKDQGCKSCGRVLSGTYVGLGNEKFHEPCLVCWECERSLLNTKFMEHEAHMYCEGCVLRLFSPKCGHCGQPILDEYVKCFGKAFHTNHFVCKICEEPFTNGNSVFEHDQQPYCKKHYLEYFAGKCSTCGKGVLGDGFTIKEIKQSFHDQCFICSASDKHLISDGSSICVHDGKIFCIKHYKQKILLKCEICKLSVDKEYGIFRDHVFHFDCFKCADCLSSLREQKFTRLKEKYFCLGCAKKVKFKMMDIEEQFKKSLPPTPKIIPEVDDALYAIKRPVFTVKFGSAEPIKVLRHETSLFEIEPEEDFKFPKLRKAKQGQGNSPTSQNSNSQNSDNPFKAILDRPKSPDHVPRPRAKTGEYVYPETSGVYYTLEILKQSTLPDGVDPKNRERYLSNDEFNQIFAVSKEEFASYPAWKQSKLKAQKGLF
jgi:hypothetical protein